MSLVLSVYHRECQARMCRFSVLYSVRCCPLVFPLFQIRIKNTWFHSFPFNETKQWKRVCFIELNERNRNHASFTYFYWINSSVPHSASVILGCWKWMEWVMKEKNGNERTKRMKHAFFSFISPLILSVLCCRFIVWFLLSIQLNTSERNKCVI